MAEYRPSSQYNTPAVLQVPVYEEKKGTPIKSYQSKDNIFISFRTFGGTERISNGKIVVEDTGVVETWYRPDIKSDCRFLIGGIPYEIMGTPEDIGMRHQRLAIRVRAVKGGA